MFKTALRLSALLLIVAGAYYCGRASNYAKSEPVASTSITEPVASANVAAENSIKLLSLSELSKKPASYRKIEFQLQKTLSIFAPVEGELTSETIPSQEKISIPNNPDIYYHPDRKEDKNSFHYYDNKIEKSRDAELLNKWCQTLCQHKLGQCNYDLQYPLAWDENGYTFRGERLGQIHPVKEYITCFPGFSR